MVDVSIDLPPELPDPEKPGRREHSQPDVIAVSAREAASAGIPAGVEIGIVDAPIADEIFNQVTEDLAGFSVNGAERQAEASASELKPIVVGAASFLKSVDRSAEHRVIADFSPAAVDVVVKALSAAVREIGSEAVIAIVRALLEDPELLDLLLLVSKDRAAHGSRLSLGGRLRLAAAALLAVGIGVPLLAGPTNEVILTNEIAIGALVATVAALYSR
jgi:hypothetical protein